jgi:hypothetical protein
MNVLIGFAPYVAFFVLMHAGSVVLGLWAAFAVALGAAVRSWVRTRSGKVLEIGNVALFAALAVFTMATGWQWTLMAVRLAVDAGLLAIVLVSLAIGRPFTIQYAREIVPREHWDTPFFFSTNRTITWVWAVAFGVLVASHAAIVAVPAIPARFDVAATVLALVGAYKFSTWYPEHARGQVFNSSG